MAISETANLLKNQASTAIKEKLLNLNQLRKDGDDDTVNGASDTRAAASEAIRSVNDPAEQFDTFLRLLTAQIENQDPLAPLDSTQFVQQLATFSGLELQATSNNTLNNIEALLTRQIALIDAQNSQSAKSAIAKSL